MRPRPNRRRALCVHEAIREAQLRCSIGATSFIDKWASGTETRDLGRAGDFAQFHRTLKSLTPGAKMFEKATAAAKWFAALVILLLALQTLALGAILAELKTANALMASGL